MHNRIVGVMLALVLVMAVWAASVEALSLTDMAGRQVALAAVPERIVCLGPGALRLIVYLEATDTVVGVEDLEKRHPSGRPYRIAHPELVNLPRCGPGGPVAINKKPDLEALLAIWMQKFHRDRTFPIAALLSGIHIDTLRGIEEVTQIGHQGETRHSQ